MEQVRTPERLFEEFPPISTEEWEAVIGKDLKGEDYEKKLVWKTCEGMLVRPYYRAEDLASLRYLAENNPGEFPYARGPYRAGNEWGVRQDLSEPDLVEANLLARSALDRGATDLGFTARLGDDGFHGTAPQDQAEMRRLFDGIELGPTAFHFDWGRHSEEALALFCNLAEERHEEGARLHGTLGYDPLAELARRGSLPIAQDGLARHMAMLFTEAADRLPNFRFLMVQGHPYHEAGASVVEELAFSLAAAVEYLDWLTERGLTPDTICRHLGFSFSVSAIYFLEMAKFRAARLLWSAVGKAFGVGPDAPPLYIHARTSAWNQTLYDAQVNTLRGTTESMSAVIGGCDSLSVLPFDTVYQSPDDSSYRLARNTQLVLKHEAAFGRAVDPSAGSYYIEHLTDAVAEAAWVLFRDIESQGGFMAALEGGFLQARLAKLAAERNRTISSRRDQMVGTSTSPSLGERMRNRIRPAQPVPTRTGERWAWSTDPSLAEVMAGYAAGATVADVAAARVALEKAPLEVEPLVTFRAAEAFEGLRLATEVFESKQGRPVRVFLWTAGDVAMRRARAMFVSDFFGVAGFAVADHPGYESVEDGLAAALDEQPDVVVLCSSDPEYAELATPICDALVAELPRAMRLLAGYPTEQLDALKAAGIEDFVHVKTDAAVFLAACQKRLGITS